MRSACKRTLQARMSGRRRTLWVEETRVVRPAAGARPAVHEQHRHAVLFSVLVVAEDVRRLDGKRAAALTGRRGRVQRPQRRARNAAVVPSERRRALRHSAARGARHVHGGRAPADVFGSCLVTQLSSPRPWWRMPAPDAAKHEQHAGGIQTTVREAPPRGCTCTCSSLTRARRLLCSTSSHSRARLPCLRRRPRFLLVRRSKHVLSRCIA